MGVNYTARVITGVPLNRIYSERMVEEKVTKYDPDTGKPIEKSVQVLTGDVFSTQEQVALIEEWIRKQHE